MKKPFFIIALRTLIIDMLDVTITNLPLLDFVKEMIQDVLVKNWCVVLCGNSEETNAILKNLGLNAKQGLKVVEMIDQAMEMIGKGKKIA